MTRWSAGLITGIIGAVLLVGLDFAKVPFVPLLIPIAAGAVAGVLVARNPAYANKAGNGALAGLIGGGVFLVGSLIFGIYAANSDIARQAVSVVEATATANAGTSSGGGSNVPYQQIVEIGIVVGTCFAGLLYMGLSVGAGAIAGAVSGRNTTPPVQMAPQDRMWTPPPGYPPPPPPQGQPPYPSGQ